MENVFVVNVFIILFELWPRMLKLTLYGFCSQPILKDSG